MKRPSPAIRPDLAQPMREQCADLTYVVLEAGHWHPLGAPAACPSATLAWLDDGVRFVEEATGASGALR